MVENSRRFAISSSTIRIVSVTAGPPGAVRDRWLLESSIGSGSCNCWHSAATCSFTRSGTSVCCEGRAQGESPMNAPVSPYADLRLPVDVASAHFADNRARYFQWLRDEAPVHRGRVSVMRMWFLSRYDDCWALLRDPRFVRNRGARAARATARRPCPCHGPFAISPRA